MYSVDQDDKVVELAGVPQSSVGAPLPVVLADEHRVLLAYVTERREPDWDGTAVRTVGYDSPEELIALVEFIAPYAHLFGPPGDEALHGHPLYERGLRHYGVYEVRHSSWVRALEHMNRVHKYHDPARFAPLRHYLFTFHDSTFECIAQDLQVSKHEGTLSRILPAMQQRLAR